MNEEMLVGTFFFAILRCSRPRLNNSKLAAELQLGLVARVGSGSAYGAPKYELGSDIVANIIIGVGLSV